MATIHGVGGAAAATGFNIKASSWTGDLNIEPVDTSGFEDNGYRTREGAIVSLDGTITGTAEGGTDVPVPATVLAATAAPDDAKVSTTLTAEAGNSWSATCLITQVSITRNFDGKADMTLSFQSNGQITQSWT